MTNKIDVDIETGLDIYWTGTVCAGLLQEMATQVEHQNTALRHK